MSKHPSQSGNGEGLPCLRIQSGKIKTYRASASQQLKLGESKDKKLFTGGNVINAYRGPQVYTMKKKRKKISRVKDK